MNADVFDIKAKKGEKISLPKSVFGSEPNMPLLAQAIRVYLSNQRQSPAHTKTRAEVRFSTKKIWKQKGTGRARHGAKSAPQFVKGGVAHGPTGEQNYSLSMNKKMKKAALKSALTVKLKDKQMAVVNGLENMTGKTKDLAKFLNKIRTEMKLKNKTGFSLILSKKQEELIKIGKNIPNINFLDAGKLTAYTILSCGCVLLSKDSLKRLEASFK